MLLETQNLSGGYTTKPIVQEINLTLITGEWLSFVGANGSGKSTLLKLISRLLKPQEGIVLLDGKAIHSQPASIVAQKLALLPQQQTIPSGLTVRQLVSLGRTPHQPWWQYSLNAEDKAKVETALQLTRMDGLYSDRFVEELSGGERQRAFLALALAQDPQILLLDEPTTYLDIRYQLELLELLKQLNQQHLTIITVLHDVNLAARYSTRIALLSQGKIFGVGKPKEILTPANLADVLGVEVVILETPVGLQICPLAAIND